MAYAERVPSPNGDYWRGRYKDSRGRYVSVRDAGGQVIRYTRKRDAETGAEDAESDVRRAEPAASARMTFGEWADTWYEALDLAETTMVTYKSHLELHILPEFAGSALGDILGIQVDAWERTLRKDYSAASVRGYRGTLSACLAAAVPRLIPYNPAVRKRGKGRRSGRRREDRAAEKIITTRTGMLLIAERMAILTGRDDEFVMTEVMYADALRLGELLGLEREHAGPTLVSVEWQLTEAGGKLIRCPPKDDSYGDLDQPPYLSALLAGHLASVPAERCPCHGKAYAFRGLRSAGARGAVPLRLVASAAGVSVTTVSSVVSGRGGVSAATRARVGEAVALTGYRRPETPLAWHWDRTGFEACFSAAASGLLPARDGLPLRPVPLSGDWPGTRVRGRNGSGRSELCWLPVAAGMTPHGARHSAKTLMEERRIPEVASESRLRHSIAGISGVYRHVSDAMRADVITMLEEAWAAALDARLEMSPRSPVAVLDRLLLERAGARKPRAVPSDSPERPVPATPIPLHRVRDQAVRKAT